MLAGGGSPDDLVASSTQWRPATVRRGLQGGLQDGVAVLHGRRLGRLAVLGQHRTGLIWVITAGEAGVCDPGWAAGRARRRGRCLRSRFS